MSALEKVIGIVKDYAPAVAATALNPAAGGGMLLTKILKDVTGQEGDGMPLEGMAAMVLGNPELQVQLKIASLNQEVELARVEVDRVRADNEKLQTVNATMQTEAKSEHWPQYSWRPFWGFVSGAAFLVVCVLVCVLAYKAVLGGQPEAISMIPVLITSFATLFGIPGVILGVSAWQRGKEKREKARVLGK